MIETIISRRGCPLVTHGEHPVDVVPVDKAAGKRGLCLRRCNVAFALLEDLRFDCPP